MERQIEGYMTAEQIEKGNYYLSGMIDDTISCWIATRINGASASLACDGNISIPLLKELDKKIMPLVEKAKRNPYQEGLDRVATTPQPKEQKFPIGARVRIADDLGQYMSHFIKGCDATVEYTHAHAYGGSAKSYSLNIDGVGSTAWYEEHQLTLITQE
jgi:hypothetical protein